MKRSAAAALSLLLAIIVTISSFMPGLLKNRAYAASSEVETLITDIFDEEKQAAGVSDMQSLLDGSYTKNAGVSSDWFVIALMRYKTGYSYSSYLTALKKYADKTTVTASTAEKYALIFAMQGKESEYVQTVADTAIGQGGIMSYIFGLHMLNNSITSSEYSSYQVATKLLSLQLDDGGWALSGDTADVDVTAMTIQALAPYYSKNANIKKAINAGVSLLSTLQLDNGGYKSLGSENPESAAQVIIALTSLGINPLTNSNFIKNDKTILDFIKTFKASDYGYCHKSGGTYNGTATSQILLALVSLYRQSNGSKGIYLFNAPAEEETTTKKATTTSASAQKTTSKKSSSGSVTTAAAGTTKASGSTQSAGKVTTEKNIVTVTGRTEKSTRPVTTKAQAVTTASSDTSVTKANIENKSTTKGAVTRSATAVSGTTSGTTAATGSPAGRAPVTRSGYSAYSYTTAPDATNASPYSNEPATVYDNQDYYNGGYEYTESSTVKEAVYVTGEDETSSSEGEYEDVIFIDDIINYAVLALIWVLAAIEVILLVHKKSRKKIHYIIVGAVAVLMTAVVLFCTIESPAEYFGDKGDEGAMTVTISIRCDTVAGRGDEEIVPSSGVILESTELKLDEGATVYDALIKASKKFEIQVDDSTAGMTDHSKAYISGINYLYEFDYGDLSGWMYSVNGTFGEVGCGEYVLNDGDVIQWNYTCSLGDDLV